MCLIIPLLIVSLGWAGKGYTSLAKSTTVFPTLFRNGAASPVLGT